MDESEAQRILFEELARFSRRTHTELVPLVEAQHVESFEVRGPSGTAYQIEMQFLWDGAPGATVRIMGSVDDGGIRAFVPLTDSVLVRRGETSRA